MSEQTFVRELERRADHVHGAPISLDDVRGRARTIQRRRRTAVAAAVAAAVAVVAVVPAVLSGSLNRADGPQPAPTPVPIPSAHTVVLHEGSAELPDGRTVHVSRSQDDVHQLGYLTDGRLLIAKVDAREIEVVSTTDHSRVSFPVAYNNFVVSSDDRVAAWVDQTGHVQVLEAGHADPIEMADVPRRWGSTASAAAVSGADCANGGCRVLVGDTTVWGATTSQGYEQILDGQNLQVTDLSPDGRLWAVHTQGDVEHENGCAGLYDPEADRLVARNCSADRLEFAPDGQHLLSSSWENNVMLDPAVLDLHLKRVMSVEPTQGGSMVSRLAWVDPTHLLVSTVDSKTGWVLERMDLSGHEQVLTGQTPGPDPELHASYVFSD